MASAISIPLIVTPHTATHNVHCTLVRHATRGLVPARRVDSPTATGYACTGCNSTRDVAYHAY